MGRPRNQPIENEQQEVDFRTGASLFDAKILVSVEINGKVGQYTVTVKNAVGNLYPTQCNPDGVMKFLASGLTHLGGVSVERYGENE